MSACFPGRCGSRGSCFANRSKGECRTIYASGAPGGSAGGQINPPFGDVIKSAPTRRAEKDLAPHPELEAAGAVASASAERVAAWRGRRRRSIRRLRIYAGSRRSSRVCVDRCREGSALFSAWQRTQSRHWCRSRSRKRGSLLSVEPALPQFGDAVAMQRRGSRA